MKALLFLISFMGLFSLFLPLSLQAEEIVFQNIRFCESTYPYQGGLLIANFGSQELNPLNREGKGYILYYKEGKMETLIPATGVLNAPKGMFERGGYLFISDVNQIVVYNLNKLAVAPQIIRFPENDLFINDLAASGNTLYASVTNTGRIYRLDISDLTVLNRVTPQFWCDLVGANGILIDGHTMYIASYPADGKTTDANVIYKIADINNPKPEKFITTAGQYDGIALSEDKNTLYVTNWIPAGVYSIDMTTRSMKQVTIQTPVTGAADMTLANGMLYIPDLAQSHVIILPLSDSK